MSNETALADQSRTTLDRLLEQRSVMLREADALQNKVAGIDLALSILREGEQAE